MWRIRRCWSTHRIISNASGTADSLVPIARILNEAFDTERGCLTTVRAYTRGRRLAAVPRRELRRFRPAAENIIPTETWSVSVVEQLLPELSGKSSGIAMNSPVPDGSIRCLVTLR